jgi:hypothetical protein
VDNGWSERSPSSGMSSEEQAAIQREQILTRDHAFKQLALREAKSKLESLEASQTSVAHGEYESAKSIEGVVQLCLTTAQQFSHDAASPFSCTPHLVPLMQQLIQFHNQSINDLKVLLENAEHDRKYTRSNVDNIKEKIVSDINQQRDDVALLSQELEHHAVELKKQREIVLNLHSLNHNRAQDRDHQRKLQVLQLDQAKRQQTMIFQVIKQWQQYHPGIRQIAIENNIEIPCVVSSAPTSVTLSSSSAAVWESKRGSTDTPNVPVATSCPKHVNTIDQMVSVDTSNKIYPHLSRRQICARDMTLKINAFLRRSLELLTFRQSQLPPDEAMITSLPLPHYSVSSLYPIGLPALIEDVSRLLIPELLAMITTCGETLREYFIASPQLTLLTDTKWVSSWVTSSGAHEIGTVCQLLRLICQLRIGSLAFTLLGLRF